MDIALVSDGKVAYLQRDKNCPFPANFTDSPLFSPRVFDLEFVCSFVYEGLKILGARHWGLEGFRRGTSTTSFEYIIKPFFSLCGPLKACLVIETSPLILSLLSRLETCSSIRMSFGWSVWYDSLKLGQFYGTHEIKKLPAVSIWLFCSVGQCSRVVYFHPKQIKTPNSCDNSCPS